MVQIIPDVDPANTVQVATQVTQAVLTKNPDVDCLWVSWSPAPVPVAAAVEQAGKGDTCKVYGLVAQSAGLQLIKEGKSPLVATSWVDLVWVGWGCIDLVLKHLSGKPVDRLALLTTNGVPCVCIDQAEANSPNIQMVDVPGGQANPDLDIRCEAHTAIGSWRHGTKCMRRDWLPKRARPQAPSATAPTRSRRDLNESNGVCYDENTRRTDVCRAFRGPSRRTARSASFTGTRRTEFSKSWRRSAFRS